LAGYTLIGVLAATTLVWAASAPILKGATVAGAIVAESRTKPVQHLKGGRVKTVYVREGDEVRAGQMLVTLDTRDTLQAMSATRNQMAAARKELELLEREIAIVGDLVARQLSARPRLVDLERQAARLRKEMELDRGRLKLLLGEARRSIVRAPEDGRVLNLTVLGPGAVIAPGGTLMDLVPRNDRLVVDGRLAANDVDGVQPGLRAKVWLSALNRRDAAALPARLVSVAADSLTDRSTGQSFYPVRVLLDGHYDETGLPVQLYPGMRTEVLIVKGRSTVLDSLLDPILRGFARTFRSH
jgi:multidrug efflux pump subunit AcrA (membrane-fusion protein)